MTDNDSSIKWSLQWFHGRVRTRRHTCIHEWWPLSLGVQLRQSSNWPDIRNLSTGRQTLCPTLVNGLLSLMTPYFLVTTDRFSSIFIPSASLTQQPKPPRIVGFVSPDPTTHARSSRSLWVPHKLSWFNPFIPNSDIWQLICEAPAKQRIGMKLLWTISTHPSQHSLSRQKHPSSPPPTHEEITPPFVSRKLINK